MSCKACATIQEDVIHDGITSNIVYYRWKNANIAIVGCKEHVAEMIKFLNNCVRMNAYEK